MAGLPASPVLANLGVDGCPGISRPATAVVTLADVAAENRRKRKLQRLEAHVTDAEIADAAIREWTAVSQLAAPAAPAALGGAAPAWFAPALAAALAPIAAQQNTMAAQQNTMAAQLANSRRSLRNAAALRRDAESGGSQPLEMLCKELPGFGALPAMAMAPAGVAAALTAAPPAPGPAIFPPAALTQPTTTRSKLTDFQIRCLQCWYNDSFGIVAADVVAIRNDKLVNFLAGR
ncbi:unnamed protein product [Symbiodinium sp. CCMP2592]|nr:unnamed protein product [Symbiodinium sp. CCMP2592]